MSAFWLCSCRHPNTKVYYADTATECAYYRDILTKIKDGWPMPSTLATLALEWRQAHIDLYDIDPFARETSGEPK